MDKYRQQWASSPNNVPTVAEIKSYGAGSKETGAKTSAHGGTSDKSSKTLYMVDGTKWQVSICVLTFNKEEDNATTVTLGLKCDFSRAGLKWVGKEVPLLTNINKSCLKRQKRCGGYVLDAMNS